jgi:hypothetical protein
MLYNKYNMILVIAFYFKLKDHAVRYTLKPFQRLYKSIFIKHRKYCPGFIAVF